MPEYDGRGRRHSRLHSRSRESTPSDVTAILAPKPASIRAPYQGEDSRVTLLRTIPNLLSPFLEVLEKLQSEKGQLEYDSWKLQNDNQQLQQHSWQLQAEWHEMKGE
ncbi:hypothetical protein BKA61DRAFT_582434 [Leptodontidium sp. MPI-SDFR-AT-0119]|nr:hypothetical protein BKA61DRAFT_582434 [Leptodontidium sp. MPI-SDFR-AT-0119]